jgi:hypothetical protein
MLCITFAILTLLPLVMIQQFPIFWCIFPVSIDIEFMFNWLFYVKVLLLPSDNWMIFIKVLFSNLFIRNVFQGRNISSKKNLEYLHALYLCVFQHSVPFFFVRSFHFVGFLTAKSLHLSAFDHIHLIIILHKTFPLCRLSDNQASPFISSHSSSPFDSHIILSLWHLS